MSLQAMVQVIERCPEKGGEYVVLLALANRADERGRGVWYDPARLAFEARMTPQHFRVVLGKLLAGGRVLFEPGAGPQGRDLLHLNLPAHRLTCETWDKLGEARRATKRACARKPLGRPAGRKNKNRPGTERNASFPAGNVEPGAERNAFWPLRDLNLSPKRNVSFSEKKKFFPENALPYRPGAAFSARYSPVRSLKEVVIELVGDAREAEAAGASGLAAGKLPDPLDHQGGEEEQNTDRAGGNLSTSPDDLGLTSDAEAWDEADDLLFGSPGAPVAGLAPDGAAPGGAEDADLPDSPENDDLEAGNVSGTATSTENLPPARRGGRAAPGSPVYERLKALCGGSIQNPNIVGLLKEKTRADNPRELWLALTLAEIEDARVEAQARAQRGEVTFRTALLEALDGLVDGSGVTRPEKPAFIPFDQRPRPGDGGAGVRKLPYRDGQRVRCDGRLGVVVAATADARQATVTVDLDDGERMVLTGERDFLRLRDALDAPPPPPPTHNSTTPVGSRWGSVRLSSGRLVYRAC
ncbi:hypothetical protein Dgeo_3013 (plasmid) [Deinococcus geothermalis DSM 11300]|uniref:Uncharacterized protein n=1 Tax=Deinococcus geothermalis (strain DSM 11300 / CIP 105573 / AG-3a) TaxID=319795 RepID=A8ZRE5_DEIGD|nr:hypothetical protein [Deinococcus geothermalis]ABW35054.1 hypothetical protein Dgeo_3013 [Deinococcus geothermalis DSM 11300]